MARPSRRGEEEGAQVHYLAARARAEPIWLLLSYAEVPAARHDLSLAELADGARAREFPTSQLPVLEIMSSRERLSQSGTIMRFLAREHGLVPSDALGAARADEVFELSQELARVNPMVNVYERDEEKVAEFLRKGAGNGSGYAVLPRLDALVSFLAEKPFFGGDAPAYCDFNAFHYLDNLDTLIPGVLAVAHASSTGWYESPDSPASGLTWKRGPTSALARSANPVLPSNSRAIRATQSRGIPLPERRSFGAVALVESLLSGYSRLAVRSAHPGPPVLPSGRARVFASRGALGTRPLVPPQLRASTTNQHAAPA
eukprot:CAMPEP_0197395436 /NCGR_PEP_ID=MMETSP1165-20131217/7067_1 /TAXON_ID=284809 /ORGANISM="Chrysocystis fragilis, Strain CCMP3189" /LENGTH=314 /DNA_ID=CAMNT_0042921197 /DNA_START=15 /DNA_END=960 /DNA_ORIENTATION=+